MGLSEILSKQAELTLADWAEAGSGWTHWPYLVRYHASQLPADWRELMAGRYAAVLESGRSGHLTILLPQSEEVRVYQPGGRVVVHHAGGAYEMEKQNPLDFLASISQTMRAPTFKGWPIFQGGWLMLLGYELAKYYEPIVPAPADVLMPEAVFLAAREVLIFDAQQQSLTVVILKEIAAPTKAVWESSRQRAEQLARDWFKACPGVAPTWPAVTEPLAPPALSLSADHFCKAVQRCQFYIAAGDSYQVNLSTRFEVPPIQPEVAYAWLRAHNPSPYMGLVRYPGGSLVCGSPELLVQVVDGKICSRPIAGTRPRGQDVAADEAWARELAGDTKERAEHLMLVDLLRNDIGRVALPGSVRVAEFMTVERYSHVMHLVSQVEGHLASGQTPADVVRALFPGGTITGAPKVRTMQIIAELEPVARGFYTGSLGWLGANGSLTLNIIIRSLWTNGERTLVQAGAGIVADSVGAREFKEASRKAQAPLLAAQMAPKKSC